MFSSLGSSHSDILNVVGTGRIKRNKAWICPGELNLVGNADRVTNNYVARSNGVGVGGAPASHLGAQTMK